jgi:hypothetical protein
MARDTAAARLIALPNLPHSLANISLRVRVRERGNARRVLWLGEASASAALFSDLRRLLFEFPSLLNASSIVLPLLLCFAVSALTSEE